jgi:hypothetical protein
MAELACPGCGVPLVWHTQVDLYVCAKCQLTAPRDVLEALAARLAPAGVLAEAGRLLANAGVTGDVPADALLHNYQVAKRVEGRDG